MDVEVPVPWRKPLLALGGVGLVALCGMALVASIAGRYPLFDLRVYLWGAEQVIHGRSIYSGSEPMTGAVFTYPPFAAVFFVPLALIGGKAAAILWATASIAALCRVSWLLAAASGLRPVPVVGAALLGVAAFLEPTTTTLLWGQINIILLWLVAEDRIGAMPRRSRGICTGVAAGLKLTPALFILNLLTTRQWRDGLRAVAATGVTLLIGAAVAPASTWSYFTGALRDTSRVAEGDSIMHPGNQSLDGTLWRLLGPGGNIGIWLAGLAVVGVIALVAARRFDAHGLAVEQMSVVGLAMVLVAPVSWTHHYVWALPALCVLARRALADRDRVAAGLLIGALVILASNFSKWAISFGEEVPWILRQVAWDPYVIMALVLLAYFWMLARKVAAPSPKIDA